MAPEFRTYLVVCAAGWLFMGIVGWLLVRSAVLPLWLGVTVVAAWIAKDVLLYPKVRFYYLPEPAERRIVGERGIALTRLDPRGVVFVHGERWQAETTGAGGELPEGIEVQVRDIRGLVLLVEPKPGRNRS